MICATKLKMKPGCKNSKSLLEIDEVYLTGCNRPGYCKKAAVHEHVKKYPGSIKVNIRPFPNVIPSTSINGEKYVRSNPDAFKHDDLLDLPRE